MTCQSWLLTTQIECEESLFSQKIWTALDRTRYMQSSKTFVMVDRPFWKDTDPRTGRDVLSMTLTDRLTRGTYLFDNGPGQPGVICLTYSWMSDALKMLPEPVDRRVRLALGALSKIYPDVDIAATSSVTRSPCPGKPTGTSWGPSRERCPATTGTTTACTPTSCKIICRPNSAVSSSPETTFLDTRMGRGRRPDLPERSLGDHASPRRPHPRRQPRTRRRIRRIGPIELPD